MVAAADLIPVLYRFLKKRQPLCLWEGDRSSNEIALTFDDGPHPTYTPLLLDALKAQQVKATFFLLGACVERYPDIARRIYEEGHALGLHSYAHRAFLGQSSQNIRASIEKTQTAIANACSIATDHIINVRPPYGICTNKTIHQLKDWGYRSVMWSVVPIDWTEPGISIVTRRIQSQTRGGDIIVLHDGSSGGFAVTPITDQIISDLKQQGLQFITIDDMWAARTVSKES